ncbi:MAG: glutamate formimidoyltransferase [Rikenellaceae bacterium]
MEKQLIECVPNFSEGRDKNIINAIVSSIESVRGVRVLHIDMGEAANRTVITFLGEPAPTMEASFRAIKKASELIEMTCHKGEHPRIGAIDVFPVVPIENISLTEVDSYVKALAKRVGIEIGIPIYLYEYSATTPQRKLLASCRAGEYEGLENKMKDPRWIPDFGSGTFSEIARHSGATVMGARALLVAINFNLNTKDTEKAWYIARKIRERGKTEYSIDGVRSIGWYIEEYGIAQVSMNITDITTTSLKEVWERLNTIALEEDVLITGTELIGLIPEKVLIEAAEQWGVVGDNEKKINFTLEKMNFGDLCPFDKNKKILHYENY